MKNFNKSQNRNHIQPIQRLIKVCKLAIGLICFVGISQSTNAQWSRTAPKVYLTTGTDKVGIGTTTPETKLHINDQTPVPTFTGINNAGLRVHGFDSAAKNYALIGFSGYSSTFTRNLAQIGANFTNSGSTLYFGTSNSYAAGITNTAMMINPSGYVGIGTTTPVSRLEVRDGFGLTVSNTTTSAVLTINRANSVAGTSNQIYFQDNGVTKWALGGTNIGTAGTNNFSLYNYGSTTNVLTVTNSNNYVGIGTTVPSTKLHVVSPSGNVATFDGPSSMFLTLSESGTPKGYIGSYSGGADDVDFGTYGSNSTGAINLTIQDNPKLTITNAGNIGIGTTTPATKFHVISPSANVATFDGPSSMFLTLSENGTPKGYLGSFSGGADDVDFGTYANNGTGAINFTIQDAPRLTISHAGNTGIGNTNPGYLLDVAGRMRVRTGGGTAGTWFMNAANTVDAAFVGMLNDNYVGMYGTGTGWGLIMNTASGNVGIGTFSPAYKLDVCGTVRAKEVRVETGWCDYVFEKDYKLPSLNDVESFIKINKHLPDVTPGNEIEKDGLEVGKVSSQMIKKIEELTLYIIDLQKQVDELKGSRK